MRKVVTLCALAAFAAIAAVATAASHVNVARDCQHAAFKPKSIIIACGDGNVQAINMHWSKWGANSAKGTGTLKVNTCTPNCAAGKFKRYPGSIVLSKPRTCPSGRQFAHLKYTFTHKKPKGVKRSGSANFACAT